MNWRLLIKAKKIRWCKSRQRRLRMKRGSPPAQSYNTRVPSTPTIPKKTKALPKCQFNKRSQSGPSPTKQNRKKWRIAFRSVYCWLMGRIWVLGSCYQMSPWFFLRERFRSEVSIQIWCNRDSAYSETVVFMYIRVRKICYPTNWFSSLVCRLKIKRAFRGRGVRSGLMRSSSAFKFAKKRTQAICKSRF